MGRSEAYEPRAGRGPAGRAARRALSALGRLRPLLLLVALIWAAHVANVATQGALVDRFGLVPRRLSGLDGVVLMPFLHGSLGHLVANTGPLLALGALGLVLAPERFWRASAIVVIGGGLALWLLGREHNHIGASGLVFGWFGFLVAAGVFERSARAVIAAGLALVLYGLPIVLGLSPFDVRVSWDAHLAGLAAGVVAARLAPARGQARG